MATYLLKLHILHRKLDFGHTYCILGGLNYALTSKRSIYCVGIILLLLGWDMGKVRDRFGGMGRFKCGLTIHIHYLHM